MKKLVSLVLSGALLCSGACAAFTDIEDEAVNNAASVLSVMEVLDGMGDGRFVPEGYLTREQFAKITACVLGKKDAAANLAATAFTDVDADNWARGYISFVASNGIIAGFPDGSFGGSQIITYAQCCTVLLRCLGYTDEEIGFRWPVDYVSKAESLKIGEGLKLNANDPITRGNAAIMVYNALMTDTKEGTKLAEKTGYKLHEDIMVFGVNKSDSSVLETQNGSFKIGEDAQNIGENAGRRGTLFVNKDNEAVLFNAEETVRREFTVVSAISNRERSTVDVICSNETLSIPYNGELYFEGAKTTVSSEADSFTAGSRLVVEYDNNGKFLRGTLYSYTMEGPKTVTAGASQIYELFEVKSNPKVIRKGVSASLNDISNLDVVYYDEPSNTIYAYDEKASGIYESAAPVKARPGKITLSGKEYKISSSQAMNKLGETQNSFAIGDYITLLFDRNGEVCDVVDTRASQGRSLAIVLDAYMRNKDGSQEYAVKLFMPDGSETEYAADKSYDQYKGELMEMKVDGGVVSLKSISYKVETGKLNKELKTFGDRWLTSDCSIIELVNLGDTVSVKKIKLDDINGAALSKAQVLHIETAGDMDDICLMYLRNVSKTDYEYGIVVNTGVEVVEKKDENGNVIYERKQNTGSYEVLMHGKTTSVYAGRRVFANGVIGINSEKNDFADSVLVAKGKKITAVSGDRIKVDSKIYRTAQECDIYRQGSDRKFYLVSGEEAMKLSGTVEVYADNSVEKGGTVRVVIIRE